MLAHFPENYVLYEHVRVKSLTSRDPKDRRDVYLYGHPEGRKKRFRSPADFFPHLLWLALDESGDSKNCACKMCTPDEVIKAAEEMKQMQEKLFGRVIKKDQPVVEIVRTTGASSSTTPIRPVDQFVSQPITQSTSRPALQSAPQPIRQSIPQIRQPVTQHVSANRVTNADQAVDFQCDTFIFRAGEVVWYNKGPAWGLAMVAARQTCKDERNQDCPAYQIQPLSHPFHHPTPIQIYKETMLRPWLSWSPPNPIREAFRLTDLSYHQIDWLQYVQQDDGETNVEIDGSVFAARAVDGSYTPIEPITIPTAKDRSSDETSYLGIFWGGEKIWTGEAVRLSTGERQDVMILQSIVERPTPTGVQLLAIGDIYTFVTVSKDQQGIPDNADLPIRFREDLKFRNRASLDRRSELSYWKLVRGNARVSFSEVRGRWYESRIMLPRLKQPEFVQSMLSGQVPCVGRWLNARGDCNPNMTGLGVRCANPLEAFGRSIPPGTRLGGNDFTMPAAAVAPMQVRQPHPRPYAVQTSTAHPNLALRHPSASETVHPIGPALTNDVLVEQEFQADGDTDISEFVDVNQMDGQFGQAYSGN